MRCIAPQGGPAFFSGLPYRDADATRARGAGTPRSDGATDVVKLSLGFLLAWPSALRRQPLRGHNRPRGAQGEERSEPMALCASSPRGGACPFRAPPSSYR